MSNGDVTNDGSVNIHDLNQILSNWGNETGQEDLNKLVSNWASFTTPDGMITYSVNVSDVSYNTSEYFQPIHDAIAKWDSIINPPLLYTNPSEYNLHITINYDVMDAEILGGAYIDTVERYGDQIEFGKTFATKGVFILNTLHLTSMKNNIFSNGKSQLYYTILHEIGHIFGIGPFWMRHDMLNIPKSSYQEDGMTKYYYTGVNAIREYKSYFPDISGDLVGIPIEDDGGSGTQNYHPEEGDVLHYSQNNRMINGIYHPGLEHELMTGWAEDNYISPLSRVTVGFLEDIGYQVNYNNVDYYNPTNPNDLGI